MTKTRSVHSKRGVNRGKEETRLELFRPELALPSNHAVAVRIVCRKVVEPERETNLVEVTMHAQSLSEIVDGVRWARFAWHHIRVGDDEWPICTELSDETAQPWCSVAQVAVVVYHSVRGVGQELDQRLVGAGVVAQPDVVLPDTVEPLQQSNEWRQPISHRDNDGILMIH